MSQREKKKKWSAPTVVAVAAIHFSLARVWLLFEGGSYSRAALIILDGCACAKCNFVMH